MTDLFSGKLFIFLFMILIISTIISCPGEKEELLYPLPMSVRVEEVTKKITAPEVSAFGTVLCYSKADVYPTTEGYINTIEVLEGDRVGKGELLSKLRQEKLFIEREKIISEVDSKKSLLKLSEEKLSSGKMDAEKKIISIKGARNLLKQKKLELDNMKRIYTNKQKLFDAGGLSLEELESVKMSYLKNEYEYEKSLNELELIETGFRDSDLRERGFIIPDDRAEKNKLLIKINTSILEAEKEVSEAELKAAEAELERINILIRETEIRSPIAGIVASINFHVGDKVKPDSRMFTVFKNSSVFVRFEAGEVLSSKIDKGMSATVTAGSKTLEGLVWIISPVINPETGTREIKILVDNRTGDFIPGSFARVAIKTDREKESIVVPETAVIRNDESGLSDVFIIRSGSAFKRNVKVLYLNEDYAVLEDGQLETGEYVCLDPPSSLSDGREVRIIQ